MAVVYPNTNEKVAHLGPVKRSVKAELRGRAARVRAAVEAHRRTGALASGTNVVTGVTDSQVFIEDEAVNAINYGHWARDGLTWVSGLHIIEEAL